MKINEFFQKGYYINLDRRPERRAGFEEEAKKINLDGWFERFAGIDYLTREYPMYVHEPAHVHKGAAFSETVYELFKKINEQPHERVLICEDDMLFYNNGSEPALQIVEKALDQLQNFPDWDMVYFGGYVVDDKVKHVSENLLKPDILLTTHAIGYNKKVIPKLLKRYDHTLQTIFDGWLSQQKFMNKYFVYPMAVVQKDGESDIDAFGRAPGLSHWEEAYKLLEPRLVKMF